MNIVSTIERRIMSVLPRVAVNSRRPRMNCIRHARGTAGTTSNFVFNSHLKYTEHRLLTKVNNVKSIES